MRGLMKPDIAELQLGQKEQCCCERSEEFLPFLERQK